MFVWNIGLSTTVENIFKIRGFYGGPVLKFEVEQFLPTIYLEVKGYLKARIPFHYYYFIYLLLFFLKVLFLFISKHN